MKPSIDPNLQGLPPKHPLVRMVRMSLVRGGMSEDEVDTLLDELRTTDTEERLKSLEGKVDKVIENQRNAPGRLENAIVTIGAGVVANVLTSDTATVPTTPSPSFSDVKYLIMAEWLGAALSPEVKRDIRGMSDTLRLLARHHRAQDIRTAVLLDGAAMFLDLEGRHAASEPLRRQALRIVRAIGANNELEGTACNNLALCLYSQRRFAQANKYFIQSNRLMAGISPQNNNRQAAIMNFVECVYSQSLPGLPILPQKLKDAFPEAHRLGTLMLYIKITLLLLYRVIEMGRLVVAEQQKQKSLPPVLR